MKNFLDFFSFLPERASESASDVDMIFNVITYLGAIGFFGLMAVMVFFVFKYARKTEQDKTAYIPEGHILEAIWTIIPAIIFISIAGWGWYVYHGMRQFPTTGEEFYVTGKQWSWSFAISKNDKTLNMVDEITVPVHTPIILNLTSQDVIHSFYLPAFRIKKDAVPGMRTKLWFEADRVGTFRIYCAEFCGSAHSKMAGYIHVVEAPEYDAWIKSQLEKTASTSGSMVDVGKQVYEVKGCKACHNIDGTTNIGPALNNYWGKEVEFEGGTEIAVADENYTRESMLNPRAKIVKGFKPIMPTFQGQLSEDEITGMIEYIKKISNAGGSDPSAKGKELFAANCVACHSLDGADGIAPSLKGVLGRAREFEDGSKITATDKAYIMESILNPRAKTVKGFKPIMPDFKSQLSEDDVDAIEAFLEKQK